MAIDLTKEPYNDDYDPSKGYTKIVAVPGRAEQAREFTQAQDILQDHLSRLGNAVFTNGDIIDGCALIIQEGTQANISSGRIFLDGLIRIVDGQSIEIKGVGNETIGAKVVQTLVTEDDDPSLRDPAQNYENFGEVGAHRVKETVVFAVDDPDTSPLYHLNNGVILNTSENGSDNTFTETLARRTYDENGSYKVYGLDLSARGESDEDHVYVSVSEGKAYVQGYEVTKPVVSRVQLDKSMTTRLISNEAKTYQDVISYELNNQPPKSLERVMCLVRYETKMTRGNTQGGIDYIINQEQGSVNDIVSIKYNGKTYQSGVDYQLTEDGVDWSLAGEEPEGGVQYDLVYNYNQVMKIQDTFELTHRHIYTRQVQTILTRDEASNSNKKDSIPLPTNQRIKSIDKISKTSSGDTTYQSGTDWDLVTEGEFKYGDDEESTYKAFIEWKEGSSPSNQEQYTILMTLYIYETDEEKWFVEFKDVSTKPVTNSRMYFDYEFYLCRKDLITIDKNGVYNVYPGVPNVLRLCESIINQDETQMVIGTVLVYANSSRVLVNTDNSIRMSQANLFALRQRVDNMEYNIALSDLDQEAIEGENATNLKGVFTDGFIGLTKADVGHSEFNCTIDLDEQELTLPTHEIIKNVDPGANRETNISKIGDVYMAPFEHERVLQQPYATGTFLVNEYAVFNQMALIELSPHTDNWIDTEKITVQGGEKTASTTLRRWWYHRNESWAESEKQKWLELTGTTGEQLGWANYNDTVTQTSQEMVLDEAIMYMRSIKVTITGSNFLPNADSLICLFNDTQVPLTPEGQTQSGTTGGSVKADVNGKFVASFNVPSNTPCGSVDVVVKNANNKGNAVYSAQGRRQVIQETVFKTKVTVQTTDPLAQSFVFDRDTVLTKVGIYFQEKDASKNILFQIRNMVNGYPGTIVYDEEIISAEDVLVSADASAVTEVVLSQPVYCKADTQYCFTILSDSNQYVMWTATLGETDISRRIAMTSQPYPQGVMFSSSNAQTWTAHQTTDLKFDLYAASYKEKGIIVFNNLTISEINRFVLAANSVDYKNAGIDWFYRLTTDGTWLPLDTYVSLDLSTMATNIQLRCEMNVAYSTSPILAGDCVNLIGFTEETTGAYVSRNVVMEEDYNTINVSFEAAIPSGTEVKAYYSTDNTTWNELTEDSHVQLSQEFNRYLYKKESLPAGTRNYRIKITLKTDNPLVRPRVRRLMSILKTV